MADQAASLEFCRSRLPTAIAMPIGHRRQESPPTSNGSEPPAVEKSDRQIGFSVECQIGQRFAEHTGEFKSVTRQAGGEGDLRMTRMQIDNEVFISRHRVHADVVMQMRPADKWQPCMDR